MSQTYEKMLATKPDAGKLRDEIEEDATITPKKVEAIGWESPNQLTVRMAEGLTGAEETALDGVIAAYVPPAPRMRFVEAVGISTADAVTSLTTDPKVLEGVVTNIEAVLRKKKADKAVCRITGLYLASGTGDVAEIQFYQQMVQGDGTLGSKTPLMGTSAKIVDSGGVWKALEATTDQPLQGDTSFICIEATLLDGAGSCDLKHLSASVNQT